MFANKLYDAALALYSKGYSIRKDVIEFSIGIRKTKMALNTTNDDLDKGIQDVALLLENVENLIPIELEKPPSAVTQHSLTIEIPPLKNNSSNSTQTKNSPRFPTDAKNSPRSSVSSEGNVLKISSTKAKRNYVLKDVDSSPMYLPTTSQSPRKSFTPPDSPSRVYMASNRLSSRNQPYQEMLRNLQVDLHRKIATESAASVNASPRFSPRSPKFSSPSTKTVKITSAQQSTLFDSPKSRISLPPIHSTHSPRQNQQTKNSPFSSPMRTSSINRDSYVKSLQMEQEKSKSYGVKVDNIDILATVAREIDRGHYNTALQIANEYFYHLVHENNAAAQSESSGYEDGSSYYESTSASSPITSSLSSHSPPPQQYICAKLYECIGVAYLRLHQIEKAIFYFHQQINIASDNNYHQVYADGLEFLIEIYLKAQNYLECIKFLEMKQILLSQKPTELLELYEKLGLCYSKLQQIDQAVIAYFLAHDIAAARRNVSKQLDILNRIGELYCLTGNFGDAIKTCKIYIQSANEVQDLKRVAEGFGTLANMYLKLLEAQQNEQTEQLEASFLQPPQSSMRSSSDVRSIELSEIERRDTSDSTAKESSLLSSLSSMHQLKSGGKQATLIGMYSTNEIIKKVAHYQQKALQLLNSHHHLEWNHELLP